MRLCDCRVPKPHPNPRLSDTCARCGFRIDPELVAPDGAIGEFFDHVEAAFPTEGDGRPPAWWRMFRAQCLARERSGRDTFGLSYLGRDNPAEALEEFCDGPNYLFFDGIVAERNGEDDCLDLAAQAAYHAAMAWYFTQRLRAKRRGSP